MKKRGQKTNVCFAETGIRLSSCLSQLLIGFEDWATAILQGPEALQELLVQRTNLNKVQRYDSVDRNSSPNPNAACMVYKYIHTYFGDLYGKCR